MLAFLRQEVVGILLWLALAGTALGQSYAQGFARYQRGDFRGAEKALVAALKSETGSERAKSLKLLGICQYMLGDKKAAGESFRQAVKLKPGLQVAANEVLDDGVIGFFHAETKAAPASASPAQVTAAAAPAKKGTFLKVQANVKGSVLIDGIIAGATGDAISLAPGPTEIEVQAQGFVTQKLKVNVAADRETTVPVTLQKPKPKVVAKKPAPKPAPKAPVKAKKSKRKDDDLFAPAPADDFYAETRDPAAEFERDTQGGYAPPAYAPQGGMPQGAQLAYTQGGQPVYAIILPQQGAYVPPPPPPAPAADYAQADPYAPPPAYPPDPAALPPDPAERPAEVPAKASSKNNLLITLLPFGAGQFQNGQTLLGGAFLGLEGYALYYYFTTQPKVTKATNERNAFVKDKNEKQEEFSDSERAYVEKTDKYIKQTKQQVQYSQIGFGALWAIGVVQALVYERDPPPASTKDKKSRKQRKYGGFSYVVPDELDVAPVLAQESGGGPTGDWSLNLRWEF